VFQLRDGSAARFSGRRAIDRPRVGPHYLSKLPALRPGPFLFLPLLGAITLRDLFGLTADRATLPIAVGSPFNRTAFNLPMSAVNMLDKRVEMDSQTEEMRRESGNPYQATRDLYLKQRRAEIGAICPGKGDPPVEPTLPPRAGKGVD